VLHVKEVLARLREAKLYLKLSKCEWHTRETEYLGFIVSPDGIQFDRSRLATIQEWPEPKTVRDIRVFIGFMNYYRRFISGFSRLALPLTKLTQKGPDSAKGGHAQRREESVKLDIGPEGRKAFDALRKSFLDVPILAHYDHTRPTKVEVDASGGAISGILSQLVPDADGKKIWRPIDFFSRKLTATEFNYDTHVQELLAIVDSLEHWRQYLGGIHFELFTDHNNLRWFMETKKLGQRHVRSYQKLTGYDYVLTHRPGKLNPADGPSRRPDYMEESQSAPRKHNEAFLGVLKNKLSPGRVSGKETLIVASVEIDSEDEGYNTDSCASLSPESPWDVSSDSESGYESEDTMADSDRSFGIDAVHTRATTAQEAVQAPPPPRGVLPKVVIPITPRSRPQRSSDDPSEPKRAKLKDDGIKELVTKEEKEEALYQCHDHPFAGHPGPKRTLERVQRRYRWKGMNDDIRAYCSSCQKCQMSKPNRHRPYGLLHPLPVPGSPWEEVTFDFITELPPSKLMGTVYDAIMVTVDRLTKMVHYVPSSSKWTAEQLAQAWLREVVRLHGQPKRVISDRGPIMNSKYWETFNHYLSTMRVMSSAFHPETDGQTERQNQVLEQYLRCFCSLEQENWAQWLSIAEYAYNDSVHSVTGITPFRAYTGLDPRGPGWPDRALGDGESPLAHGAAAKVLSLQQECRTKILAAQAYQKKYADKKRAHLELKVGDKVLISNRHIKSTRPKKKLDWKYIGPGIIKRVLNPAVCEVDMPGLGAVHPVFHVSLLEPYRRDGALSHPNEPIVDTLRSFGDDVYEIDKVLDRRPSSVGSYEYLVQWRGYPESENSWEPGPNISAGALNAFWLKHNIRAKRQKATKEDTGRVPRKKRDK